MTISRNALVQLVLSHIRGYLREPEAIFWAYGFPLIMVLGLGAAFNNDVENKTFFTVSAEAASSPMVEALRHNAAFEFDALPMEDALHRLRQNKTPLVVSTGEGGQLEYFYDPTNPQARTARAAVDDALQRAAGRTDPLKAMETRTDAPGSRYVDFLVPGLIGMNIMGAGLWGIGFALVDLRVKNLIKRLMATPMKRGHLLLSLVSSRVIFFIPEMIFLLVAARLIFGVPVAGSYFSIVFIAFLGSVTFAGLGLLTASRAKRIESISGLMNLVMIPMWLGSGIFFSSERFPGIVQPFIQALPLTQLINALRAVILAGDSLASQSTAIAILSAWCVGSYALALKIFRWN